MSILPEIFRKDNPNRYLMQQDQENSLLLEFDEINETLVLILRKHGFTGNKADLCSTLFTETSLDGVYSHGLNRFPLFIENVRKGFVKPENEPSLIQSTHNFEKWDGNLGPGNLNAWFCMERAVQLAKESGTGMVSIRNTNHWMRGGSYGIQAAKQNCIGICITNTKPNMPPWGGRETKVGNNPFIISIPDEPYPVLLDMAMSQFSYGKFEILRQQDKKLPFDGGFDRDMKLTNDPGRIIESELALPMGYWKGSGLAILLDLVVSLLSDGLTSSDIGMLEEEYALSQFFLTFDLDQLSDEKTRQKTIKSVLESVTGCDPLTPGQKVYYPGQQTWIRRTENTKSGIPVSRDTWKTIKQLLIHR